MYAPAQGTGSELRDTPPSPPAPGANVKEYEYSQLPHKYWKRYQYAARFVRLVRSKTPKVTLYTKRAKCMLMENGPEADCEVVFYDGAKVNCTADGVRIIEQDGTSLTLQSSASMHHLSPGTQQLWQYVEDCRQRCQQLENLLTAAQDDCTQFSYFPVTVGRRPTPHTGDVERTPVATQQPNSLPSKVVDQSPTFTQPSPGTVSEHISIT